MKSVRELFDSFSKLNVMVIGDVMLDAYIFGKVDRISPEAPVPVVAVKSYENRLGGAANVAINVRALGANPVLCSVIGKDDAGEKFKKILDGLTLSSEGLLSMSSRKTTLKTRIIGNNHQLMRVDEEESANLSAEEEKKLIAHIQSVLEKNRIDVIIFEDYDKGVLGREVIQAVIKMAQQKKIPVTADPKKRNFNDYNGVTLFKPNFNELQLGLKTEVEKMDAVSLSKVVSPYREEKNISMMIVTLSEHGIFFQNHKENGIIPASMNGMLNNNFFIDNNVVASPL